MKTSALFRFALLGAAVSLASCKPGDDSKPQENPVSGFIDGGTTTTGTRSSGPWELGIVISSSTNGKITQVGARMPEPGTYRITIWDAATKAVLRQKSVEQTAPDKLVLADIDALPVAANTTKLVVSVNSQSAGTNKKYFFASNGGSFLPFAKGSILVESACYRLTAPAVFPDGAKDIKSEMYGYPDVTFIPD
jgi:hypothetical protein